MTGASSRQASPVQCVQKRRPSSKYASEDLVVSTPGSRNRTAEPEAGEDAQQVGGEAVTAAWA